MDVQRAVRSQQLAALKMLREAVAKCPDDVWDAPQDKDPFWYKVHHTLYWAHLHLKATRKGFGTWNGHHRPNAASPVPRSELLAGLDFIREQLLSARVVFLPARLEQEIADIRHIQQHTGELFERLGSRKSTVLHWTEHVRKNPK